MLNLSSLFKKLVWLSLSSLNLRVIVPSRVFGILNFSIGQFKRIREEALSNKVGVNDGNIILMMKQKALVDRKDRTTLQLRW